MSKFRINEDFGLGAGLLILSAVFYILVIPRGISLPSSIDSAVLSPDFWPKIIVGFMGATGLLKIAYNLLSENSSNKAEEEYIAAGGMILREQVFRFSVFIGSLLLLYFSIDWLGMVLPAILAMLFFGLLAGERRFGLMLSIAVVLPIGLYFFFSYIAQIPIPLGIFESLR